MTQLATKNLCKAPGISAGDRKSMNRQFLILLPYYLRYGFLIIRENILGRRKRIPTPEKGIYKYMKVWNNTVFLGIISLIHLLNKHLLRTHGTPRHPAGS